MIKRIMIIALVALVGAGSVSAKFRVGVKAGLNVNKINFDDAASNLDADNQNGFTGGVVGEYIAPAIGIGFDLSLMYTQMKGELSNNGKSGEVSKNFIEIPLNLKYKLGLPVVSKFVQPMIYTGPTMALKLDKSVFENIKTKTVQMGWNIGVGLEFFKHLQINGGYTFGINNVAKYVKPVNENLTLGDVKLKNNYWTVTAAWMF